MFDTRVKNYEGVEQECTFQREYRGFHVWSVRVGFGPVEVTEVKPQTLKEISSEDFLSPGRQIGIRCVDSKATVDSLIDDHIRNNNLGVKDGVYSRNQEPMTSGCLTDDLAICAETLIGRDCPPLYEFIDKGRKFSNDDSDWIRKVNTYNDHLIKMDCPTLHVTVLDANGLALRLSESDDPFILGVGLDNRLDMGNGHILMVPEYPGFLSPHVFVASKRFKTYQDFRGVAVSGLRGMWAHTGGGKQYDYAEAVAEIDRLKHQNRIDKPDLITVPYVRLVGDK